MENRIVLHNVGHVLTNEEINVVSGGLTSITKGGQKTMKTSNIGIEGVTDADVTVADF